MITVLPGQVVEQNREDVVVYRLPFERWSADLDRPDNQGARFSLVVLKGSPSTPLSMRVLPYRPGTQSQDVRIAGASSKVGEYEVVRTVKSSVETRRRSFIVRTT